ncbi:Fork-head domain-containing protein [Mycena venus]|uniref:Fork-head domain-containing protein n=1 Tax=Mycena venus TaxID=2733690 RepID=A0A8H7CQZ2_9AGAR|nr:Fork-head domain-containing protein [Mycena venus]
MHGDAGSSHAYRYPEPDRYRLPSSSSSPSPHPDAPHMRTATRSKLTGPYYLQNILNSDSEPEVEPSSSKSLGLPHSTSTQTPPEDSYTAAYLRRQLCLPPAIPVDLWAIADPPDGQKPFASLPTLIKLAIHGSAHRRLTLQGICDALISRFTWFHAHRQDDAWKNSVRHNLSLNKVFRKIPRDVTQMGKGCFWELDLSRGEGHKRPRKRRKYQKSAGSENDELESAESADNSPQTSDPSLRPFDEDRVRGADSLILLKPYSPPPEEGSRQSRC